MSLWSAESGELLNTYVGHSDAIRRVKFSADGSRFVTISDTRAILWRVYPTKQALIDLARRMVTH